MSEATASSAVVVAATASPASTKATPKKVKNAKVELVKTSKHPTYQDMIKQAVERLRERKGSSRQAIQKYIQATFQTCDDKVSQAHLKLALKRGVESGFLKRVKGTGASGSFRLNVATKPAPTTTTTTTTTTSSSAAAVKKSAATAAKKVPVAKKSSAITSGPKRAKAVKPKTAKPKSAAKPKKTVAEKKATAKPKVAKKPKTPKKVVAKPSVKKAATPKPKKLTTTKKAPAKK